MPRMSFSVGQSHGCEKAQRHTVTLEELVRRRRSFVPARSVKGEEGRWRMSG